MIRKRSIYLMILPAVCIIAAFFFLLGVYTINLSFFRFNLLRLQEGARFVGLGNFLELVKDPIFPLALYNTLVPFTLCTISIRLIVGLMIALLLNSFTLKRLRLSGLAQSLILIPWLTPPVVAVVIWKWLYHETYGAFNIYMVELNLLKTGIPIFAKPSTVWVGVNTILIWRELPFVVVMLLAGLQSIPRELYEAAEIDGATRIKQFLFITLPQLKPVLAIVLLVTTIWTFNNFVYVWLSTQGGPGNVTQVLASYIYVNSFTRYEFGYASAIGTVMATVMTVFAIGYIKTIGRRTLYQQ